MDDNKALKNKHKADLLAAELRIKNAKASEAEAKASKALARSTEDASNAEGMFGTKSEPRKSMSTFLRNQNKLQVSTIAILDRKSAILIRICTTLVSGLIVLHGYIDDNVVGGHWISVVLLIGMMITLVMAMIATKPMSFLAKNVRHEIFDAHRSSEENVFFMMKDYNLKEYQESMQKVVARQDLQLGNQIRSSYFLGRYNANKGRMVDLAYNTFIISFLLAGLLFLYFRYSAV